MSAPNFIDMSSMTIGTLRVISRADKTDSRRRVYWNCKCSCGVEKVILGAMLRTGHYKTCGCGKKLRPSGNNHKNWKGGKHVHGGYVQTLVSPGRYVAEQRVVMEEWLGRPLRKEETVHHRNGNKLDNDINNLELWVGNHGKGQRVNEMSGFFAPQGYEKFYAAVVCAIYDMAYGKGNDRHVIDSEEVKTQVSPWLVARGFDYARGQAVKKIDESLRMPNVRAIIELRGAISYLAMQIVEMEGKLNEMENDSIAVGPNRDL